MKASFFRFQNFSLQVGQDQLFPEINLQLQAGECLGLVGAGGSGRSLFLRALCGLARGRVVKGEVTLNEVSLSQLSSSQALSKGIFYLAHRPVVFEGMSVFENLFLTEHFQSKPIFSHTRLKRLADQIFESKSYSFRSGDSVSDLSRSQRFQLAWSRFYLSPRKLLLIDESISSIPAENRREFLLDLLEFKKSGGIILFAIPPIESDQDICDHYLFLAKETADFQERLGEDNTQKIRVELSQPKEESVPPFPPKNTLQSTECVLRVENFHFGKSGQDFFKDISFELRKGEILGLLGSVDSGRTELFFSFFAALSRFRRGGELVFFDEKLVPTEPTQALRKGLVFVSGFRTRFGLFKNMSVGENLSFLHQMRRGLLSWAGFRDEEERHRHFLELLRLSDIRSDQRVADLNNDAQQKLMMGRWLSLQPKIFFLDEAFRGLTQQGKLELAYLVRQLSDEGISFVFGSSQFQEIFQLCHRTLVMKEGKIKGELDSLKMTRENLYQMLHTDEMLGGQR